jgi:hypothetical protein
MGFYACPSLQTSSFMLKLVQLPTKYGLSWMDYFSMLEKQDHGEIK